MSQAKKKTAYEALSEIQSTLNAPKNQKNKFGGYSYRSCEDILQAVKPLLGSAVILVSDDIKLIGDRFYVEATAKFILGDIVIENKAYARETLHKKGMDEAQITGATSSYARKYALNGLLLIDDNKDADTQDNSEHAPETPKQPAPPKQPGSSNQSSIRSGELAKTMSEGNDFATVQFWRGLTQEQQQFAWKELDKDSQKLLKNLIQQYPPMEKAS